MKINTIETAIYSEPDEQNRVKLLGMRKAEDVFLQLFSHLQENNLLPDEYFIYKKENFEYNGGELPKDCSFSSHTEYGGSEGIYTSITVYDEKLDKHIGFATGKTLEDNATAYLRMSRIGAECELMLNNEGYPIEYNELKGYKLNQNEKTIYTIVEQHKNTAILQRHIANSSGDPTPYIVAYGLKIKENNIIEWDSGKYFYNLKTATNELENENQDIGKLLQNSLINKVENEWDDYRSRHINPDGTFIRHFQDHLYHRLHSDIHKSLIDMSQNGELSLSQMIALIQNENVITTIGQEYDSGYYGTTIKEAILGTANNELEHLNRPLDLQQREEEIVQQGSMNKSEQIFTYVTDNDSSEISNSTFKSVLEEPQAQFPPKGKAIATRIPEPINGVMGSPLSKEKTKESENQYDNNPTIDFGIF